MQAIGQKKVIGVEDTNFTKTDPEHVITFEPEVTIQPGETFDILVDCKSGFSVYLPYPMFFEDPALVAVPADPNTVPDAPQEKWWRVQLKRKPGNNYTAIRKMAYCVYIKDLDNFAVGNSPPKMTIEP